MPSWPKASPPDLNAQIEIPSRYVFGTDPLLETFFYRDHPRVDFPGWNEFVGEAGPEWDLMWDVRSNRPNLIQGQGLPWFPGKGNNLTWNDLRSPCLAGAPPITHEMLECMATDFIACHQDLLRVPVGDLKPVETATGFLDLGRVALATFDLHHRGIPVVGGRLSFIVNSGNLIQIGIRGVSDIALPDQPSINAEDAWSAVRQHVQSLGALQTELSRAAELVILPFIPPSEASTVSTEDGHVLAWLLSFKVSGDVRLWRAVVNAGTGEILEIADMTRTGEVTGGVRPLTARDPEEVRPLAHARVWNPPSISKSTDRGGHYDFTPATAAVMFDGDSVCLNDRCAGEDFVCGDDILLTTNASPGDLGLGISFPPGDCTVGSGGGGAGNTTAARTASFHVDNLKQIVSGYHGSSIFTPPIGSGVQPLPFLSQPTTVTVNFWDLALVCNATGDLTFYRSGSINRGSKCPSASCPSTGEVPGAVAHELGHYLDGQSFAQDRTTGEAFADTLAYIQAHRTCVADGMYPDECCSRCTNCSGWRQISYPQAPSTLYIECGPGCSPSQPLIGMEPHCEGQIASGAYYDMSRLMANALDPVTGRPRADSIFLFSIFATGAAYHVPTKCSISGVDGCGSGTWYTTFLAMDDDNGNLADATPLGCQIWKAFEEHGISCGDQPPCFSGCPAPFSTSLPQVEITRQSNQTTLQWEPLPRAQEYVVFRNVLGPYAGYVPFANVAAPSHSFVDQEAPEGFPYYYALQAVAQDYCRSRMSTPLGCNYDKDADGYFREEYALHLVEDEHVWRRVGWENPATDHWVVEDFISTTLPQVSVVHDSTETTDEPRVLFRAGGLPQDDHLYLFDVVTGQLGGPRRELTPGVPWNQPILSLSDGNTFVDIGIHDHMLVYTRTTSGPSSEVDLFARDLNAQPPIDIPVCTATGLQVHPQTDGRFVVWLDERNGRSDVYYADFASEHRITYDDTIVSDPHVFIENGIVVYRRVHEVFGSRVYAYDIARNEYVFREGDSPQIGGGRMVYRRSTEIRVLDLATLTDVAVVSNPKQPRNPVIFGDRVAYEQTTNPNVTDVHVFDLLTSKDERITYGTEDGTSYSLVGAKGSVVVVEQMTSLPKFFFVDLDESVTCNGCGLTDCSDCDDADGTARPDAGPSYCSNSY